MVQLVQQPLFGGFDLEIPMRSKSELLDWSPSKRGQLEQCPRRYYYQYYADPLEVVAGQTASLKFYRKLSNSWMLAGILLHQKIKEVFGIWRSGGMVEAKPFVKDIAQRWQKVRESSVQFARSSDYSQDPGRVLLMEFIFADATANKMWWDAGQRLEKALDGFLTLPSIDRFRKGGLVDDAVIEKRVRVEGQGFRMRGQIDLAWREKGRVAVADWKSGGRDGADSDLQLLAYALGVQHRFECELDELDLFRVELGTGNIVPLPINQQEAARAKARMAQDTALMVDLKKYGEQRISAAFTPTGSPKICRLCPYQRICPGSEA